MKILECIVMLFLIILILAGSAYLIISPILPLFCKCLLGAVAFVMWMFIRGS